MDQTNFSDQVIIRVTIPDDVRILYPADVPGGLDSFKNALEDLDLSRKLGGDWFDKGETAILAVPSVPSLASTTS